MGQPEKVIEAGRRLRRKGHEQVSRGDFGALVKDVQEALVDSGYLVDIIDGTFGPKMEGAVRRYNYENFGLTDFSLFLVGLVLGPATGEEGEIEDGKMDLPDDTTYTAHQDVPFFCQGDDRWADVPMSPDEDIRKSGCALCGLASIAASVTGVPDLNPEKLLAWLKDNDGFLKEDKVDPVTGETVQVDTAIVLWGVFAKYLQANLSSVRYRRLKVEGSAFWFAYIELLRKGIIPLVRVRYRGSRRQYDHFVVGIGMTKRYGAHDLIFHDPGTRSGNAYDGLRNTLATSKRGYVPVALDWFEPT